MTDRPTIDVSHLPAVAFGSRSPSWWGNVLFMLIETTSVALLLASYFYLWRNYPQSEWPPPRVDQEPALLNPVPDLLIGTLNVLLLLLTIPLGYWLDHLSRERFAKLEELNVAKPTEAPADVRPPDRPAGLLAGLAGITVLAAISVILRYYEFPGLKVRWNENAYASVVWSLLGLQLIYIVIELVEFAALVLWVTIFGLGQNQATDVSLSVEYWYWTVAVGVLIYLVVYWFPRVV